MKNNSRYKARDKTELSGYESGSEEAVHSQCVLRCDCMYTLMCVHVFLSVSVIVFAHLYTAYDSIGENVNRCTVVQWCIICPSPAAAEKLSGWLHMSPMAANEHKA